MRVFFDTDVVLDVLLEREPHVATAAKLFALLDHDLLEGVISATTVTTVFYIAAKSFGRRRALDQVRSLLDLFNVVPVDRGVLASALSLGFADYEDGVIHEAARSADAIVTRDRRGFTHAALPIVDPAELLAVMATRSE